MKRAGAGQWQENLITSLVLFCAGLILLWVSLGRVADTLKY